jgi:DNA invertase Pin-like site-specific DNA recombinase
MTIEAAQKVTPRHLARTAYLYIRQSTIRQVVENTESTQRQYALRERAVALGWPPEQLIVIDTDLGQSGASAADRAGFQRLVADVGLGRAGIVLGLEVSRLARNSSDWHRLLELCALTETLILDEDGLDDPTQFNDRLLLGLKGAMSEAELHLLRARLRGGLLNKARRGELRGPLPVGLVYDPQGRIVLDPDQQVQASVRLLFQTFLRTGTAYATVKTLREQGLSFPRRPSAGPRAGELIWESLGIARAIALLHNPRYAGAYPFGRGRWRKQPDGRTTRERLPQEQWLVLLRDAHPGYLSWEEHEQIQRRLRANALAHRTEYRLGPPREGPALLQGLAVCGRCGARMTVSYHRRGTTLLPTYYCHRLGQRLAEPTCQSIDGAAIDAAVGQLLVATVTPLAIEVALAVQQEIQARLDDADRLRRLQVERAQYEAELARQRYLLVDPANRLVADALEADWNHKLRARAAAQDLYDRQRQADRVALDDAHRQEILRLATDFPAIWQDPDTPARERKRMAALLLEDVTVRRGDQVTLHVRFRGGTATTLTVPRPLTAWERRRTSPAVLSMIDALLTDHTDAEVAALLNAQGLTTGAGQVFTGDRVKWLRAAKGLPSFRHRLRAAHLLTAKELATALGVSYDTVKVWRRQGRLHARRCNDKGEWLYALPSEQPVVPGRRPTAALTTAFGDPAASRAGGAV